MIHFDIVKNKYTSDVKKDRYIIKIVVNNFIFTIIYIYSDRCYKIVSLSNNTKNLMNFDSKEAGERFLKDFFIQNLWRENYDIIRKDGYFYE